ncbi:MAG: nicotinate phosphoribosyltransferase [Bacteroidota bacterium]
MSYIPTALHTDLYQLTMAYGYWKRGLTNHEATFHLFYRRAPFGGSYAIAAGLEQVIQWLNQFEFREEDLDYLGQLTGNNGAALFEPAFLDFLRDMRLGLHIQAMPEGTLAFPNEPILRVSGPLIQAQLVETALLNMINFQTLIATKASRIVQAADGDPVLEFGLRRAQGPDGAQAASRAAYIGGCIGTSNVEAGKKFDIPIKGTHAHSWVMAFDREMEAFEAYADAMPNNCIFLVDTYDSIAGVHKAIKIGKKLREKGHEMVGIRLDSGDLADLSIQSRQLLDMAGFPDAVIVASNDLDEYRIQELKEAGAQINTWGIGTKLVTAYDQPALGGVYKLAAIKAPGETWKNKIKLSDDAIKVSIPGVQQVRRYSKDGVMQGDVIFDQRNHRPTLPFQSAHDPHVPVFSEEWEDLLVPIFQDGTCIYQSPTTKEIRRRSLHQLQSLPEENRSLQDPKTYPVGLSYPLYHQRAQLINEIQVTATLNGRESTGR